MATLFLSGNGKARNPAPGQPAPGFAPDSSAQDSSAEDGSAQNWGPAGNPTDYFAAERGVALLLIALVALWLRARDPGFTTAYMDESIYVVYGRMFLARHFEAPLDSPLRWSFGWYLWPMMSAWADRWGGLTAVRELSALLGTASVMAVYGFARRLFGSAVGLGSAAIFAVMGPAVMASRIATRDAGSIFFFLFGLWAFVYAWQTNKVRGWLSAAACLICAFLCKYIVAIYFVFFVLLALRRGWRAALAFCLPMGVALGGYLVFYWQDLRHLLFYGGSYSSLRASAPQLWEVYVAGRIELWLIALLALLALAERSGRKICVVLWLGAALALAFQWKTRADFDFWKHAVYPLIFLVSPAVHAVLSAAKLISKKLPMQAAISVAGILWLCAVVAWTGKSLEYNRTVFWPNVEPVLSYFEGRPPENARILVDDSVFRYYFHPRLEQSRIADPYYFQYGDAQGEAAYRAAVEDGWFEYIVLDGGMGAEAEALQRAIRGHLQSYSLRLEMPDPILGQTIQIFQRTDSSALQTPTSGPSIEIFSPAANSFVGKVSSVSGVVHGAAIGWRVRTEVFSNRWYPSQELPLEAGGKFETTANFGGVGRHACHQMLRVRAYDQSAHPRAVAVLFNLKSDSHCQ